MKISLIVFLLIALVSACNSIEKTGLKGLNPDEIINLRSREKAQCEADIKTDIADFRDEVSTLGSDSRGDRWSYTLTKTEGTTNTTPKTATIYIWKVTADYLYYLIASKDAYSVVTNRFLRISKNEFNAMVTDLASRLCDHVLYPNVVGTASSSNITHKIVTTEAGTGTNTYEVTTTYTFAFSNLPFLGSFTSNVVKKEKNDSGNFTNANGITLKGVLTAKTSGSFASDSDQYTDYTNAKYCIIKTSSAMGMTPVTYAIPYEDLQTDNYECTTTPGTGPVTGGLEAWTNPGADLTI